MSSTVGIRSLRTTIFFFSISNLLALASQQIGIAAEKRCGLVESIRMRLPICCNAAVPIVDFADADIRHHVAGPRHWNRSRRLLETQTKNPILETRPRRIIYQRNLTRRIIDQLMLPIPCRNPVFGIGAEANPANRPSAVRRWRRPRRTENPRSNPAGNQTCSSCARPRVNNWSQYSN